jgi:protein QN1
VRLTVVNGLILFCICLRYRLQKRERELEAVTRDTARATDARIAEHEAGWRQKLLAKQNQVELFRTELDTILDVIRELQRSGVRVHVPSIRTTAAGKGAF